MRLYFFREDGEKEKEEEEEGFYVLVSEHFLVLSEEITEWFAGHPHAPSPFSYTSFYPHINHRSSGLEEALGSIAAVIAKLASVTSSLF